MCKGEGWTCVCVCVREGGSVSVADAVKKPGERVCVCVCVCGGISIELTVLMLRADRATAAPLGSLMRSTYNTQGPITQDRL